MNAVVQRCFVLTPINTGPECGYGGGLGHGSEHDLVIKIDGGIAASGDPRGRWISVLRLPLFFRLEGQRHEGTVLSLLEPSRDVVFDTIDRRRAGAIWMRVLFLSVIDEKDS